MAINEVFSNPTVKSVHFEIRFPSLFYIEQRIGDLQTKIMEKFPESQLVIKRQLFLADASPKDKFEPPANSADADAIKKIWTFKSGTGVEVGISDSSLGVHSLRHKTYNNPDSEEKFRDMIEYVTKHFFEVVSIPLINRLGLRYIDQCPIPKKENETFQSWYNTTFPLSRFNLADATEMIFRTTVSKNGYFIRYVEALKCENDVNNLVLDFDGFAEKIKPNDCLTTTDKLHEFISNEYEVSIKDPVYEYMRKKEENQQ